MKKALFIVLAILVMVNLAAAQDGSKPPTPAAKNTTNYSVDGYKYGTSPYGSHLQHGCMLCHAPHSANAVTSTNPATFTATGFATAQIPSTGYTGPSPITSIPLGNSGAAVAGSIYLWGAALTNQTYTTWEGTSINQGNITAGKNSAVVHTLLCMSCHDNANSGHFMTSGATSYGQAPGTEYGTGNAVTDGYGEHIGLSQVNSTGTGWNSASSLANSHPVHVQYQPGNQGSLGVYWNLHPDGTFVDTAFNLDGTNLGHPAKLWLDGGPGGPPMVECTSCHDPHRETVFAYWNNGTNSYTVGTPNSTIYYLRGPYSNPETGNGNINANFCRSCHYDKSGAYQTASGALN